MGVKDAFLGRLLASSDKFSDEQVAQTITLLIEHGVKHEATDIHIEPFERFAQVRYRIDNTLRNMHKLPLAALPAVSEQIKDLAEIREREGMLPGEGQFSTLVGEEQFEIHVHTMPVVGGEKIVLHISRRLDKPPTLEQLGYWGSGLQTLQHVLSRTHGLVVVATPRRSGKTTLLHSMLQLVNTPAVSVATVENTIEYRVRGASQITAGPRQSITYTGALQAALNQDPNIVMINDVPDKPTAALCIQGAASGHLVLAGLHADNTTAALVRLQALSDESFLLSHSLRVAVSQRLVRRLCRHCAIAYTASHEEARHIEKLFGIASPTARKRLHELDQEAAHAGIGNKGLATEPTGIAALWKASDDGCEACNHTGFQGVVAIVEVLPVENNEIESALLTPVPPATLRQLAAKQHFISMEFDGLIKALRGETTIAEIVRTLAVQ